jgi:hypothetical protein
MRMRYPDFRLNGPFYRFDDDKGPTVVAWAHHEMCPIFYGTYDDCQELLRDLRATSANTARPASAA